MDIEQFTREFAGVNYEEPKIRYIETLDLFESDFDTAQELVALLSDFIGKHPDCTTECEFTDGDSETYGRARVYAVRMETVQETADRIARVKEQAEKYYAEQRKRAEAMAAKYLAG